MRLHAELELWDIENSVKVLIGKDRNEADFSLRSDICNIFDTNVL